MHFMTVIVYKGLTKNQLEFRAQRTEELILNSHQMYEFSPLQVQSFHPDGKMKATNFLIADFKLIDNKIIKSAFIHCQEHIIKSES